VNDVRVAHWEHRVEVVALEVIVERLTERLAIRDAHIDAQKAQHERLLTEYGDLQRAFADSCARIDALSARIPDPNDLRRVEELSEVAHDAARVNASARGWGTNPRAEVPWEDAPDAYRAVMRAMVRAVLAHLRAALPGEEVET